MAAWRSRVTAARIGHLATVGADGSPHVVPICFALVGDTAYSAVDHKPKRHLRLRRLTDIAETGRASLLIDYYDEDWSLLWWARLDGPARLVTDPAERGRALTELAGKYDQYAQRPPEGPVIAVDAERWTVWSATGSGSAAQL